VYNLLFMTKTDKAQGNELSLDNEMTTQYVSNLAKYRSQDQSNDRMLYQLDNLLWIGNLHFSQAFNSYC